MLNEGGRPKRLEVDGKFFRAGGCRVFLKAVSYGPFPDPQPDHGKELARIREVGFNALRVYDVPDKALLDAALDAGLWVIVGLSWQWGRDFMKKPSLFSAAQLDLVDGLKHWGGHPAVAAVMVANEIPSDMVRWMGVVKVRHSIETLIDCGRQVCPELLFAYSNFPTTEYLEPDNADFTAMNVFLEDQEDFASYLPRLHNVAGDRPVLISEFGLDSLSHGEEKQLEAMLWQLEECLHTGMAGTTVYAWSDRWLNGGRLMEEWAFGMNDPQGREKPALLALSQRLPQVITPEDGIDLDRWPMFSVVVCTFNGGHRMSSCLLALQKLDYPNYEVIVVDDGSTDETAEVVSQFDEVRLFSLEHAGLSAARNRGATEAVGEIIAYTDDDCEPDAGWLKWLAHAFFYGGWDVCGGPNLPPTPVDDDRGSRIDEAVVASAPGAPSHVLLGDIEAEHLPGCNLVVKKEALMAVGGFEEIYRVAGDDVDFCWRLREAAYKMGFAGGAFVWHRRRTSLLRYFKQQYGYGKAEAILMRNHPGRFKRGGGARWMGRVYAGGAMCADQGSVIYHGLMGMAPYQNLSLVMQPQRPLAQGFQNEEAKWKLSLAMSLQPRLRAFSRWLYSLRWRGAVKRSPRQRSNIMVDHIALYDDVEVHWWSQDRVSRETVLMSLLAAGWQLLDDGGYGDSHWDLIRDGLRVLVASELHEDQPLILTRMEMKSNREGRLPPEFEEAMIGLGLIQV